MFDSELCLSARSVSQPVHDWLRNAPMTGKVLSVSGRAWLTRIGEERLVSIVAPEVGDGPFNIVLDHIPREWLELQPGALMRVQRDRLQCGRLEVTLEGAVHWEPRPDWERLRASARNLLNRLEHLQSQLEGHVSEASMWPLVQGEGKDIVSHLLPVQTRAQAAAEALWTGWCGDKVRLGTGAAQLAGLGVGLTPSGDDFLLGTMLCAWLAHAEPRDYCATVVDASVSRTTLLSSAYLRSASVGQFSAPWHRLLKALEGGSDEELVAAAIAVLAYGHTSGADALAGFLWMGLRIPEG